MRSPVRRPALCLALLALLAQLWLTQLSVGHLARMLGERAAWGEICTTGAATHPDDTAPDDSHSAAAALGCPVCAAAAAQVAAVQRAASAPPAAWTLQRLHAATAPVLGEHRAGLRPPAQAPPLA